MIFVYRKCLRLKGKITMANSKRPTEWTEYESKNKCIFEDLGFKYDMTVALRLEFYALVVAREGKPVFEGHEKDISDIVSDVCEARGIELVESIDVQPNYVIFHYMTPTEHPDPVECLNHIKRQSAGRIGKVAPDIVSRVNSVWTRDSMISTKPINSAEMRLFIDIEREKTRKRNPMR